MKEVIYWSLYVLTILGILIWSLVIFFSCTSPIPKKIENLEIEHVDLDSLHIVADSAVEQVHHTINDLDNEVKLKEEKIKIQLIELDRIEELSELKQQKALSEIDRANQEKKKVDSLMVVLANEFEEKWDAYDNELILLERDLSIIINELNTAVEEIVTVVIQLGQEHMLYDRSTKICELAGHLPPGKLDSLINNTPISYKEKRKRR